MLLEALGKPIRYRLKTGVEINLIPGKPIDVPEEAAQRLLDQAAGKVRVIEPTSGSHGNSKEDPGDYRQGALAEARTTLCGIEPSLPTVEEMPRCNQGPNRACYWEGVDGGVRRGICVLLGAMGTKSPAECWIGIKADAGGFRWVREDRLRSIQQYETKTAQTATTFCAQCGGKGPIKWISSALLCAACSEGKARG